MADKKAKGRQCRGETHGRAKVTRAQVTEIRERRAGGATLARLASDYGLSDVAISKIARGRTWTEGP